MAFDMAQKITLRPGIRIGEYYWEGARRHFPVKDQATNRFYLIKRFEHFLMTRMDGSRSIDTLFAEFEAFFQRKVTARERDTILSVFAEKGFVQEWCDGDFLETLKQRTQRETRAELAKLSRKRWRLFRPTRLSALASWFYPGLSRAWILWPTVALFVVCSALFLRGYLAAPLTWPEPGAAVVRISVVFGLLGVFLFVHELAHGFSTMAFGGVCHEIGIKLGFFNFPIPYCRIETQMLSRGQQVYTYFAGLHLNMVILIAAFLLMRSGWLPEEWTATLAVFYLLGSITMFMSSSPYIPSDGYLVFTGLVRRPKVGVEAQAALRRLFTFGKDQKPLKLRTEYGYFWALCLLYPLAGVALALAAATILGMPPIPAG